MAPTKMNYPNIKATTMTYENSVFKEMADDIKTPFEQQLASIEIIADSAKSQAESAKQISDSSKIQADIAKRKAGRADIKSWIAIAISALALIFEFAENHVAILQFFKSFF